MNFKIKFNLPNTATDTLLKFISLVLFEVDVEFVVLYILQIVHLEYQTHLLNLRYVKNVTNYTK